MSDQHKKCHPSLNSQRQRWAGIVLFVGVPWVFIYTLIAFGIDLPSEIVLKDSIFRSRPRVDTVVVGDSRVLRLNEEAFQAKGWAFFNMGLSGMSPEDVALQLGYALSRGTIRRVVMGVSFESLSEKYAFEHSRYYLDEPFMRAGVSDLAGTPPAAVVGRAGTPVAGKGFNARAFLGRYILPLHRATPQLHMLLVKQVPQYFLPNGNVAYHELRKEIARGTYDCLHNRNPKTYFERPDSEVAYLQMKALSESGKDVYRRVFAALRKAGLPTIVFETGRTPEYQALLDADPLLHRLQAEWRDFFRKESGGCVGFVEAANLPYDPNDFIDAVHFMGMTEHRVAARLADELATLELVRPGPRQPVPLPER